MKQTIENVPEIQELVQKTPTEESKQAAVEALVTQEGQLSAQPNVYNLKPLFITFAGIVTQRQLTQQEQDSIVIERGTAIADFFNTGATMGSLKTLKEKMAGWKTNDFPNGGAPEIIVEKAALPERIGQKDDVYSAAFRDFAAIAADKS